MLHKSRRQGAAAAAIESSAASAAQRIERVLQRSLALAEGPEGPPLLAAAMRHAVFPGGARIRPRLCLAVAARLRRRRTRRCPMPRPPPSSCCTARRWCTTTCPASTTPPRAAACPRCIAPSASALAVLAGDALIVLAFQTLAARRAPRAGAAGAVDRHRRRRRSACPSASSPARPGNASRVSIAGGLPPRQDRRAVRRLHRGRRAGGRRPTRRRGAPSATGLGEAYQVADDMRDVVATDAGAGQAGRPGRDAGPAERGVRTRPGRRDRVLRPPGRALRSTPFPPATVQRMLRAMVRAEAERLVPQDSVRDLALAA